MHCSLVARLGPWGSGPSSHRSSRFCYPNKPIKSNCSVFAHAMLFHAFLALLMLFPGPQMASNHSPPHPLTLSASYLYAFLFCDFCILVVIKLWFNFQNEAWTPPPPRSLCDFLDIWDDDRLTVSTMEASEQTGEWHLRVCKESQRHVSAQNLRLSHQK